MRPGKERQGNFKLNKAQISYRVGGPSCVDQPELESAMI